MQNLLSKNNVGPTGLGLLLILILAFATIPLSPWFLDLALGFNLSLTFLLFYVSVYSSTIVQITTFPSLLLLTTLLRLSLNIASTRVILSKAEAGMMIESFGSLVMEPSLGIGILIFALVSLIQYIVISKGSERVAEVSARFSLDALPGKQMSIDADLRSGCISLDDARKKRNILEQEADFYGAMDGTMKFVKGDTIVGILMILINLFGGLCVGVFTHHLGILDALHIYARLTIGDGLVSQIPSLIMAITSGFLVTRIQQPDEQKNMASQIMGQLMQNPMPFFYAATFSFILSLLPGFPFVSFACLSLIFLSLASVITIKSKKALNLTLLLTQNHSSTTDMGLAMPLSLHVQPWLYNSLNQPNQWGIEFGYLYNQLQSRLLERTGLQFPQIHIIENFELKPNVDFQIRIYDIPYNSQKLVSDRYYSRQAKENSSDEIAITQHGSEFHLWDLADKSFLTQKDISHFSPHEMIIRAIGLTLLENAAQFMDMEQTRHMLNKMDRLYPELVGQIVPKRITIQTLTEILKRLVDEQIPVKDLKSILESLAYSDPSNADIHTLTEQVRMGLRSMISYIHLKDQTSIKAYIVDATFEDELTENLHIQGQNQLLALSPEKREELQSYFLNTIGSQLPKDTVIITQWTIRRHIKSLLQECYSQIKVLSFQELEPTIKIESLGIITTDQNNDAPVHETIDEQATIIRPHF